MSAQGNIERVYLDAAGGQRPNKAVFDLASPLLNASWNDGISAHHEAKSSQVALGLAIETVANSFGVGTNQVLPVHRLSNAIEFLARKFPAAAVSKTARRAAIEIFQGTKLEVDQNGRITAIPKSGAVFFPAVNQETGVIEDLPKFISEDLVSIVDATEWFGRTTTLITGDFLIARASSWGGPQSVCFVISTKTKIEVTSRETKSLLPDAFNLLVAATALENLEDVVANEKRIREYSNQIKIQLRNIPKVRVHGDDNTVAHLISFDIENVDSESAAIAFDSAGIAIGSGSACGVESKNSSHVLEAMGITCAGNLRISIPLDFREDELGFFLEKLPKVISELTQTL